MAKNTSRSTPNRARLLIVLGATAATIALFVAVVFVLRSGSPKTVAAPEIEGLIKADSGTLTQNHTTDPVTYAQNPPVGGDHNPVWLNCGIYKTPVPTGNAVHDLEHGAVWITYSPDLAPDQIASLERTVKEKSDGYITLSPYAGLPSSIVASAWGVQVQLADVSDGRLIAFIDRYQNGPQNPEPGAICSRGVGTPES